MVHNHHEQCKRTAHKYKSDVLPICIKGVRNTGDEICVCKPRSILEIPGGKILSTVLVGKIQKCVAGDRKTDHNCRYHGINYPSTPHSSFVGDLKGIHKMGHHHLRNICTKPFRVNGVNCEICRANSPMPQCGDK